MKIPKEWQIKKIEKVIRDNKPMIKISFKCCGNLDFVIIPWAEYLNYLPESLYEHIHLSPEEIENLRGTSQERLINFFKLKNLVEPNHNS